MLTKPHSRTITIQTVLLCFLAGPVAAQVSLPPVSYRLTARFSDAGALEIAGTLRLPSAASAGEPLTLVLTESAKRLKLELLETDRSAIALSAEKQSGDDPPERRKWRVVLPSGSTSMHRSLRFSYLLDKTSEPIFHLGKEAAFAGGISTAWYPQLIGTDGTRLLALGEVTFQVPRGQTVYMTGKRIHSAKEKTGGTFRFLLTTPVYFSFASGPYHIQRHGTLSLYLLRKREGSLSYLRDLQRVIHVLSREFGPFPYESFALVEVDAEAGRAAGFDGASLDGLMLAIGPFLDRPFNLAFYGHEIGHQWWGGVVRRKGPDGAYFMDEALAQWGSLRVVQAIAGQNAAEQYRRVGHPGYYFEYSGFSYLRRSQRGLDHQLATLPISDGTLSRRVANSKGMFVWDMLAETIGRERFRAILREIIRKNWFKRITWDELWNAIESSAGQDLKWFYRQWLERTGAPEWTLSWRQEGQTLRGVLEQREPFYRLYLKVLIHDKECRRRQVQILRSDRLRTDFEWRIPFQAASVVVDPHFEVLHWTEEYRREAEALEPYTDGDLKLLYGKTEEARVLFSAALKEVRAPDRYALRFLLEFGLGQAFLDMGRLQESREHLLRAASSSVKRPEALPEVFAALAEVAFRTGDQPGLEAALRSERLAEQEASRAAAKMGCR